MPQTQNRSPFEGPAQLTTTVDISVPAQDDSFWTARSMLTHIRAFAQARMCAPWAVLGAVLARVVATTPPWVALPAIVGGHASINLFVALVGRSGVGKGAATAAARDAVMVTNAPVAVSVGSGEGLAHVYAKREKGEVVRITDAALVSVAEIDTLTALSGRSGSTILPELRKAWSGEDLGFAYADPSKRLPIPAHSYRLAMIAGVQPERAKPLLDDADAGTPQRFLWLPATDLDPPDTEPEEPLPQSWAWQPGPLRAGLYGLYPMPVFWGAVEAIRAARRAANRGEADPLDGHRLLAKLKVAAALGLLDNRVEVTEDDWTLAGQVMATSDRTRARVQETIREAAAQTRDRQAMAEALLTESRSEIEYARQIDRIGSLILRRMPKAGRVTEGNIKRELNSRDRKYLDDVLADLVQRKKLIRLKGAHIDAADSYELVGVGR